MIGIAELAGIAIAALGMASYGIKLGVEILRERVRDMQDDRDYWRKRAETQESDVVDALKNISKAVNITADTVQDLNRQMSRRP